VATGKLWHKSVGVTQVPISVEDVIFRPQGRTNVVFTGYFASVPCDRPCEHWVVCVYPSGRGPAYSGPIR